MSDQPHSTIRPPKILVVGTGLCILASTVMLGVLEYWYSFYIGIVAFLSTVIHAPYSKAANIPAFIHAVVSVYLCGNNVVENWPWDLTSTTRTELILSWSVIWLGLVIFLLSACTVAAVHRHSAYQRRISRHRRAHRSSSVPKTGLKLTTIATPETGTSSRTYSPQRRVNHHEPVQRQQHHDRGQVASPLLTCSSAPQQVLHHQVPIHQVPIQQVPAPFCIASGPRIISPPMQPAIYRPISPLVNHQVPLLVQTGPAGATSPQMVYQTVPGSPQQNMHLIYQAQPMATPGQLSMQCAPPMPLQYTQVPIQVQSPVLTAIQSPVTLPCAAAPPPAPCFATMQYPPPVQNPASPVTAHQLSAVQSPVTIPVALGAQNSGAAVELPCTGEVWTSTNQQVN